MSDRPDADTSTHVDTPHSVTLRWMSNRPDAQTSDNTQHPHETYMLPAGFEPAVSAGERPQTQALDCSANWITERS